MADLSESGPSGVKRRKTVQVKNEKNLTIEEMMQFLYNSDIDEDETEEIDDFSETDTSDSEIDRTVKFQIYGKKRRRVWQETTENGMKQIPFTKQNGLLVDTPGDDPYEWWFRLLVDEELLDMIVLQTNNYALEVLCASSGCDRSRISQWKDLSKSELLIFVGDVTGGKSHAEKVVMHLMRNFFDNGHSVHMDNYGLQ
ncbi:hypothetical protein QE152_g39211 [Popillia japonica]|uniref:Uncharacterized protein n=1 Tax=Popillia japonica TaxID=7064 RepID=A0AAW1HU86_POPJA